MSCLICLSPILLDRRFPRSDRELIIVASALGELEQLVSDGKAKLITTSVLSDFMDDFDWTSPSSNLLIEIYRLLSQLLLRQDDRIIDADRYLDRINSFDTLNYYPHPLPSRCENQEGVLELWSNELGKILWLHDRCCSEGDFFIGIACAYGLADEELDEYINPENYRVFPLVSHQNIEKLIDAYDWEIPSDIHQKNVTVENIKKNYQVIGGVLESPEGGSHYKVKFPGQRPWTFSVNTDPLPERYLKQLVEKTGYPIGAIKTALISGKVPKKILRFDKLSD